jgi:TonB family protein
VPIAAVAMAVSASACGGAPARTRAAPAIGDSEPTPVVDDDPDDGLELLSTQGHLDPDAVRRAIEPHAVSLEACYRERVERRRWLGGEVEITWEVAADGVVTSARLSRSDLGAWAIEKCVLGVAERIAFGAPKGGPTHVAAPLSFSAGSAALAWDDRKATRAMASKPKELETCAKRGQEPTNVSVTVYVGPRGKVQSVGFGSPSGIDPAWADCAAELAMQWVVDDPRGHVAKLSFLYNPAGVADGEGPD